MYNSAEGKRDQFVKERNSAIIMLASTALLGVFIWATLSYGNFNNAYFVIYSVWVAVSLWLSKAYMFFTPRRRYGVVKEIKDYKETWIRAHGGAGRLETYSGAAITEVTLRIAFDTGVEREYEFVYRGDLKKLQVGDRIGIFRFLKMPVMEG